jgi:hypothetical protein
MGNTYVISGLRDKRARIAGEIARAQHQVDQRRVELAQLDSVIRMFSPDCNPDMIPPIQPAGRRDLFFRYGELPRVIMTVLREAKGPMALDRITDTIIKAKGFMADHRITRHIRDCVRATLIRMEGRGITRRIIEEPDVWWELAR